MAARSAAASAERVSPSAMAWARISVSSVCLRGELGGFFFAALLLGGGGGELGVELRDALRLAFVETVGLLEVGVGVAAALFEAGKRGCGCAGGGL